MCADLSPSSLCTQEFLFWWLWAALAGRQHICFSGKLPLVQLTFSLGFSDWSQVPGAALGYKANSDVSGTLSFCLPLLDPSSGMASYAKQSWSYLDI